MAQVETITNTRSRFCQGCWDQMHMPIPIGGPLALPFRAFGITRSKMNPNICTICERSFSYVKKQRHISDMATILFADIRGYTRLSEQLPPELLHEVVSIFQGSCAEAIWAHDGIVNKQMGDGLMAMFNFPIKIENHSLAAVMAALDIQRLCAAALNKLKPRLEDIPDHTLGVGIGIHTGDVEIGEFSTFRSDFTAIGGAVNLAARLEAQAGAGEILVSADVAANAEDVFSGSETRALLLKGIDHPVVAHVLNKPSEAYQ